MINKFSDFMEHNKRSIKICGNWEINPKDCKKIRYKEKHQTRERPSVYFWILKEDNLSIPLYVGKAGKGVTKRMKEHENGFNGGSKSGVKKKYFLRELLQKEGYKIAVAYKESLLISGSNLNLFTELDFPKSLRSSTSSLSNYSVEEEIIISFFKNDIAFPMNYLTDKKKNDFLNYLNNK